jgi:hypothetical protein
MVETAKELEEAERTVRPSCSPVDAVCSSVPKSAMKKEDTKTFDLLTDTGSKMAG